RRPGVGRARVLGGLKGLVRGDVDDHAVVASDTGALDADDRPGAIARQTVCRLVELPRGITWGLVGARLLHARERGVDDVGRNPVAWRLGGRRGCVAVLIDGV